MNKTCRTAPYTAVCAAVFAFGVLALPAITGAQQTTLPDAPRTQLITALSQAPAMQAPAQAPTANPQAPGAEQSASSNAAAPTGPSLSIAQAEQMALRNNPNISVARLLALAQGQVTREARSAEMPQAAVDLDAVDAHDNSRITGGDISRALTSSRMLNKAAGGLTVSQLITDFGRTHNLVLSAQSSAKAQLESERATELDITLTVDQAFYQALSAQSLLKVAQETVSQRQATSDQVGALTKQKIRSELDKSFADVQLSQANLLLLDAQNSAQAAMAALNNVLGSEQDQQYSLADETSGTPPPAPDNPESMVQAAFTARPDLAALSDKYIAARQYTAAERELWMPTISALASGGGTPVRGGDGDLIQSSWYFGAGADVSIPVFNGFLYNAEEKEAKLRAQAAQESVRNLRDAIARDVRTAVLNAQTAYQRITVTRQLLDQANLALDLASARYNIGLSGIVEITQAQLDQTQAEIAHTNARYAYQTALAVVRYEIGQ